MCTVTVIPIDAAAFRLVCNRDERLMRLAAESPALHRLDRRAAIYPRDPVGGGTWIGVNDTGLAAVLLNRSSVRSSAASAGVDRSSAGLQACPGSDPLCSRGLIVPRCLAGDGLDEAIRIVRDIVPGQFAPFSLVLVHRRQVVAVTSDGRELSLEKSVLRAPLLFTSSSLGDALVDWPRRQLFAQCLGGVPAGWLDGQARYHQHQWSERPDVSIRMERQDAATVSRSVLDVSPRRIRFHYEPLPPRRAARAA
jgi:hypothetical protein